MASCGNTNNNNIELINQSSKLNHLKCLYLYNYFLIRSWQKIPGISNFEANLVGRYIQLQLVLTSAGFGTQGPAGEISLEKNSHELRQGSNLCR